MGHAGKANKFLEILGHKLRPVIGDNPRPGLRISFFGPLQDNLNIRFRHLFPDLPVNDETAAAIENAAQIIERAADIEIRHIDMPMFKGLQRLDETGTLETLFPVPFLQQTCLPKNAPGTAGADRNDISVQEHERQPTVALKRIAQGKFDDGLPFPRFKPEVTWDQSIMFIDFAVTQGPCIKLALRHGQPGYDAFQRHFRFLAPLLAEVNNGVADIMGNPTAIQSSPSSFFN